MKKSPGFSVIPILAVVMALVVLTMIGWATVMQFSKSKPTANQNAVACTLDAKVCPDGTSVGRVPPACEFAACPATNTNGAANINAVVNTNATADATKDWKTFTNTTYGWSVKYPSSWQLTDTTKEDQDINVETTFSKGVTGLQQFFTDNRADTLEQWRDKQLTQLPNAKTTVTELTIAGVRAIRISTNVYDNASYVGFRKENVFVNVITSNADMVTNGMLATFIFTDQTPATKDWKTYTNAKHGFSFRYPPSWTISEDTTVDPTQIVYIAKDPTGAEGQLAVAPKGYPGSGAPDGTVTNRAIQFGTVQGTQITLTLPDKSIWTSYVNLEQAAVPKGWEWGHPIHLSVGSKNSLDILNLILSTFTFKK